ncbi:hypothetical protein C9J85_08955 [Haloferax sp. wsp5]|nr:hypothetical protein C9J85_08955 [Haloferax sp. wsp5]
MLYSWDRNESQGLTIRNAEARTPETADYRDGTTPRHYTRGPAATSRNQRYGKVGDVAGTGRHDQTAEDVTISESMVDGRDTRSSHSTGR